MPEPRGSTSCEHTRAEKEMGSMSGLPCGQVLSGRGYRSREKGQPVDLGPASKLSCSGGSRRRSSQQSAGREFGAPAGRSGLVVLFPSSGGIESVFSLGSGRRVNKLKCSFPQLRKEVPPSCEIPTRRKLALAQSCFLEMSLWFNL